MEERIGQRINLNRTTEAVGTGADQIAVGCPFCRVMLTDGLTELQSNGDAREEVEVLDVAQMLLASVKAPERSAVPTDAPAAARVADAAEPSEHVAAAGEVVADGKSSAPAPAEHREAPVKDDEPAAQAEPATAALTVPLPPGETTAAETWSGHDVESILEGDDVDISEFKSKLKAELKAEVLAEIREELSGALNSDSGVSAPVSAESVSSSATQAASEPESKPEPEASTSADTSSTEEAPAPAASDSDSTGSDDDEGGDQPMVVGSL